MGFFEYISKTHIMEFYVNGINYKLHGRGCFAFSSEKFLNWNFGYRSRWCGVDPWILRMTLKKNKSPYVEFYDGKLLKEACDLALNEGLMLKTDFIIIPYQYRKRFYLIFTKNMMR